MKITTEYLRFAPESSCWCAIDADSYDGAEDADPACRVMGQGPTALAAAEDLVRQLREFVIEGDITAVNIAHGAR